MGMTVSISCDRPGCAEVSPDAAAPGWFNVRGDDLDDDVWLCSRRCLQEWA